MKKSIFILAMIMVSCNSKPEPAKPMTIAEMKNNRSDVTYMDFKFGTTLAQVEAHAKKLIDQKKIGEYSSFEFDLGYEKKLGLEGYTSKFSIGKYSCTELITPTCTDDKLNMVEITLFDYPADKELDSVVADVVAIYISKYGPSMPISELIPMESKRNIKYYFQKANQAIYVMERVGFITITFQDLLELNEENQANM